MIGASFQLVETRLGLAEDADSALVSRDQLLEGSRTTRQLGYGLLEGREQILEACSVDWTSGTGLAQIASGAVSAPVAVVAATRPRMPFTKRPASSPENVLASSIDSLIAALVGTWRSMAIS